MKQIPFIQYHHQVCTELDLAKNIIYFGNNFLIFIFLVKKETEYNLLNGDFLVNEF